MIREEWGGSVRWLSDGDVTVHDAEGNEIEIPKCKSCGISYLYVVGKDVFAWVKQCECKD